MVLWSLMEFTEYPQNAQDPWGLGVQCELVPCWKKCVVGISYNVYITDLWHIYILGP